jgi:peptidoglycan/xylan/chitin deacetylase (PgdA/CDA1 family)
MDALDQLGWKATFFLLGENARKAPGLTKELVAAGHEVGVHGERHDSHFTRTVWDSLADIRLGRDTVTDIADVRPEWFRPAYGSLSTGALVAAHRLELRTVLWTAWGRDWRAKATPRSVTADVCRQLTPGATVLLHDSDCTSAPLSWRSTLGSLPLLADAFAAQGLAVGPLRDHGIANRR